MPQLVPSILVLVAASIALPIAINAAVSLVSSLLGFGGGGKADQTERSIKSPTPVRIRGYGLRRLFGAQMAFDTNANGKSVDVWAFHDGRANALIGVYLNDEVVELSGEAVLPLEDGTYGGPENPFTGEASASPVNAGVHLGLPTETAFATVIAALPGIWTANHRGDGIVSGFLTKKSVKSKNFLEVYPQGDNVVMSLALELQLVFDPRDVAQDPDDPDTWVYSTNAVLHLLHYYMTDRGEDYATKHLPVIDAWIAAADVCDEAMTLAAGGTEPRYRGCVVYDKATQPADVVAELLACFDGWTCLDEHGRRLVYAGKLYTPTVSIGPADIESYQHQAHVEEEDSVNNMTVQYVSAEHKYSTVEAQAWRDEADITLRGRELSDTISPQVPSFTQARRLAKRAMLRRNAPDRGTVSTLFSGRAILGHRFINLTIEEAGAVFFDGVAEIVGLERNYDTGGVDFEWIAVDPAIDAWDPETEDGFGATPGERTPLTPLAAPEVTSLTISNDDDSGDEAAGARIAIEATGPDRTDLTWFARWRVKDTEVWATEEYPDTDPGAEVALLTSFVPVNNIIEVQIMYMVGDGRPSPWSSPTSEIDTTTSMLTAGGESLTGGGELLIEG